MVDIAKIKEKARHEKPTPYEEEVLGHEAFLYEMIRTGKLEPYVNTQIRFGSLGYPRNPATSEERLIVLTEVFKRLKPSPEELEKATLLAKPPQETPEQKKERQKRELEVQRLHNAPINVFCRYFKGRHVRANMNEIAKLVSSLSVEELEHLRSEVSKTDRLSTLQQSEAIALLNMALMERQANPEFNTSILKRVSNFFRGQ